MKRRVFNFLMAEYRAAKDEMREHYYPLWSSVFDEYGLNTYGEVASYLFDKIADPSLALKATDPSVGTLHVLVRKLVSLTSLRLPEFRIDNENPRHEAAAGLLNYIFPSEVRRTRWEEVNRLKSLWGALTGSGAIKLGVSSRYFYDEGAWSARMQRPETDADRDMKALPYGMTTEWAYPEVRHGYPNISHIPTTCLLANPGARLRHDVMRWYIRHRRPLIDARHDDRYGSSRRDIPPIQDDSTDEDPLFYDKVDAQTMEHAQYCEVVEVIDLASRQYCVVCEGVDEPLRDWTPLPYPDEVDPIHLYTPIEHPSTWRGIPYGLLIIKQAKALNHMRSILKEKIGRDGKVVYLTDESVGEDVIQRMNHARDGE